MRELHGAAKKSHEKKERERHHRSRTKHRRSTKGR